jgi:type IV pilus assembly protein PilN
MTTKINLLPWREERREQLKKEFQALLGLAALAAVLILGAAHFFMNTLYEKQRHLNDILKQEIKNLDGKIKDIDHLEKEKKQLIDRIKVIQSLQKNRPEIVDLFNDIVIVAPAGTHFSSITRQGESVFMKGFSTSNSQVSKLMRNMKAHSGFISPTLSNIRADTINNVRMIAFDLSSLYSVSPGAQPDPLEEEEVAP